ncbi:MAG: TonB-dependent receptor [Burkholderiaceae bacterium]|nr:TonB-dependent receptor [Burkholderiaceae bacterium]
MQPCRNLWKANNRWRLSALTLALTIAFSNQTVYAQSGNVLVSTANNPMDPVIVSGSRFEESLNEVPANVKIITRDEIENSTSTNIPEVLSQIGGLNVRGTNLGELGLGATVDMGGYGATANSTTLVLVDGQRINPIDSLEPPWATIPIDSIERIEILQGGASVQFGNGALGGVINIITNGGKKNVNQVSVTYGSYNTQISNAIFRNTHKDLTIQITANASNTNGWRQNAGANTYAFDGKVSKQLTSTDKLYLDLFYAYANQGNPGGVVGQVGMGNPQLAKFNNIGANTTNNNSGFRFGLIKSTSKNSIFEFDGSYNNRAIVYNVPYYNSSDPGWPYTSNTNTNGWQIQLSPRIKLDLNTFGKTVFGYDFSKASQSSTGSYGTYWQEYILNYQNSSFFNNLTMNNQSANTINNSVYVVSRLPLNEKIELSGGYRRQTQTANTSDSNINTAASPQYANQTNSANAGDIAINFNYLPGQRIYAKWNQSFRFPNIDEFWGLSLATYQRIFSGILKPEVAQTFELGGNWTLSKLRITSSIFSSISEYEIRYNPSTGYNFNSSSNINRRGIVFDTGYSPSNTISVSGGGKFQRSYFADGPYQGKQIPLSPDLLLNARANYFISSKWSLGGVVNFASNQAYEAAPTITGLAQMPSYTVGDVYLGYKDGGWDTKFTIKNVGNASYATYGVYGFISLPGGTGANNYAYYPSNPRSYFLTAKYSF